MTSGLLALVKKLSAGQINDILKICQAFFFVMFLAIVVLQDQKGFWKIHQKNYQLDPQSLLTSIGNGMRASFTEAYSSCFNCTAQFTGNR